MIQLIKDRVTSGTNWLSIVSANAIFEGLSEHYTRIAHLPYFK